MPPKLYFYKIICILALVFPSFFHIPEHSFFSFGSSFNPLSYCLFLLLILTCNRLKQGVPDLWKRDTGVSSKAPIHVLPRNTIHNADIILRSYDVNKIDQIIFDCYFPVR